MKNLFHRRAVRVPESRLERTLRQRHALWLHGLWRGGLMPGLV